MDAQLRLTYLPIHLALIKYALATLLFSARSMTLDESSQSGWGQSDDVSKKPRRSASSMHTEQMPDLVEELGQQNQKMAQQMQQHRQETKEEGKKMAQQMERQRQEAKEENEKMVRQMEKQMEQITSLFTRHSDGRTV